MTLFRHDFLYSHFEKKNNIFEVAFVLEKSVSRPYARVSAPGAPGEMDILKLRFFLKRVYIDGSSVSNEVKNQRNGWSSCKRFT